MFWAIFSILFFLVIIYLFLVPIVLIIDTTNNEYYVQLRGLAKASIQGDKEEILKIRLQLFFLNFYFYPLTKIGFRKKKKARKKSAKKNRIGIRTGLRILKSFKVKKILLDIDTGDYIFNAKLYPFFELLKHYTKGNFKINFDGRNEIALYIKNRPIHIIRSFINS